jgi:hypothetical protein
MFTDVSEKGDTSSSGFKSKNKVALFATCFTVASCLTYSSILKMEATCSSETSVDFQLTTRRSVPEDKTFLKILNLRASRRADVGFEDLGCDAVELGTCLTNVSEKFAASIVMVEECSFIFSIGRLLIGLCLQGRRVYCFSDREATVRRVHSSLKMAA